MKKISFVLVGLLAISVLVGAGGLVWWRGMSGAPSNDESIESVVIVKGSSAERVGQKLEEEGVIRNALAFKFYVQVRGLTKQIPPGEFRLARNLSLSEVVSELLKGPTQVWVTVPEGLRREEVVEKYIEGLELTGEAAASFRLEFLGESSGMEGYLFPDTYLFPRDVSATRVVRVMRETFDIKFSPEARQGNLSLVKVVTLASILERETLTAEERPVVAGILMNRLNNDWPLQADATVQYALGEPGNWWPRPLTGGDLEINSAYNTYKYIGLPPGPIANPGLTSLEAVVNYEQTDYWFYLHDSEGKIHYAETLEEHNRNVRKYLQK